MLRVVIGIVLCASLHEASAENKARIYREIKLWHPYSQTVVIEPHILTIAQNSTHLLVNSTDSNFKSCAIALVEHTFQRRIEAMEISRKIIVWGVRAKYETDIGDRIEHTVLVVDPWHCSFKAASTFEEERPLGWWSNENAQVVQVAEQRLFDVYYPSLKTCAPCRYSLDGKRIDLGYQLEVNYTVPKAIKYTPFFRIQRFLTFGITGVNAHGSLHFDWGYIFAYNFGNGSSVIKVLDENFHVARQQYLDHRMDGIAVNGVDSDPNIFVCYMPGSMDSKRTANNSIYCKNFDGWEDDMKLQYAVRLPTLEGYTLDAFSLNTGPHGGDLYVSVVHSLPQDPARKKFSLYWLRSSGKLMDSATFYELPEGVDGQWRVRSYFTDNANVYCIENTADRGSRVAGHEYVKCASLSVTYHPALP